MPPNPSTPRRVVVVLAGCGVHDGSEVHEATLTLLALARAGAQAVCAAPNVAQPVVINHLTGEPNAYDTRSVLVESARLARGAVLDLAALAPRDFDALVIPGGYGAVRTLCDHAVAGRDARVLPVLEALLRAALAARRPMGFFCLGAMVAARALGHVHPTLTVGNDAGLAADLEAWGAVHRPCEARAVVVDREHRLVSTPAYLVARGIADVDAGIDRAVRALLELG